MPIRFKTARVETLEGLTRFTHYGQHYYVATKLHFLVVVCDDLTLRPYAAIYQLFNSLPVGVRREILRHPTFLRALDNVCSAPGFRPYTGEP